MTSFRVIVTEVVLQMNSLTPKSSGFLVGYMFRVATEASLLRLRCFNPARRSTSCWCAAHFFQGTKVRPWIMSSCFERKGHIAVILQKQNKGHRFLPSKQPSDHAYSLLTWKLVANHPRCHQKNYQTPTPRAFWTSPGGLLFKPKDVEKSSPLGAWLMRFTDVRSRSRRSPDSSRRDGSVARGISDGSLASGCFWMVGTFLMMKTTLSEISGSQDVQYGLHTLPVSVVFDTYQSWIYLVFRLVPWMIGDVCILL